MRCKKQLLPFFGGRRAAMITAASINRYVVKTRSIFERYDVVNRGDLNDGARRLDEHMVTKQLQRAVLALR